MREVQASRNRPCTNFAGLNTKDVSEDEKVYLDRLSGKLLQKKKRFRLIDLFAGAGGMTLGFTGSFGHIFKPVWGNDINHYAVATYKKNFKDICIPGDLVDILKSKKIKIPHADVVIGGPPCQGFSLLNKNRKNDNRKQLWLPFLEVVERSGAQVFVMENVPQLLGSSEHKEITRRCEAKGFKLAWAKLCAADYGVSQSRWRAFIVGSRFKDPNDAFPPKKTHYKPNNGVNYSFSNTVSDFVSQAKPWCNVRDAIADLPPPVGTEIRNDTPPLNLHFGRSPTTLSKKRYRAIPEEGMNRFDLLRVAPELTPPCWIRKKTGGTDLFGRLWWDRTAFTIRTEFFKPEKGRYLHPSQHRPITHREAARLQSFPDHFIFMGSKIEVAKQIGNAVPPLMAARIADSVYALLSSG